jgi:7-carboxy-7-deazaguanine synthase
MKLSELFYSIQGEGLLTGVPSVFVRTTGCNLRCQWCDTPYTSWQPEGREYSMDEILAYVTGHSKARHTVVTGGEPMIQPQIVELTRRLREAGEHVTIETAGTVYAALDCDLMSISPKLANSIPDDALWRGKHEKLRIQPDALRRLMSEYAYQLKFVVMAEADLVEIRELVKILEARAERVLLMPEGTDRETLRQRGQWLVEVAKREGYRFSPRLHVELYGNQRGV